MEIEKNSWIRLSVGIIHNDINDKRGVVGIRL